MRYEITWEDNKFHRKCRTYNERFGATAAVTPQKVTCEHERQYPAERLV